MTTIASSSTVTKPLVSAFRPLQEALAPYADLMVRAAAGLFLMPHGAQKLFGLFGGYGVAATGQFFESKLGLPAHMALIAGLIEFFGGLALATGFATRIAAGFVTGMMAVAVLTVHLHNGFFWTDLGYEYPLLWGILSFSYVIRGGGRKSIDALIGWEI